MMNKIDKYKLYGRSKGRKKISIFDNELLNKYQLDLNKDFIKFDNIILDVGSGNGENTIFLAKKYPRSLILAAEIFLDGNINLCNLIENFKINNIKIYSGNINKFLDTLENENRNKIHQVWILFPDPWPKKRHHKRRLVNDVFLESVFNSINKEGNLFIATDSSSYLKQILSSLYNKNSFFEWLNDKPYEWDFENYDLPLTKYYKRAKRLNNFPFFISLNKI